MNATSSRAHTVITIELRQIEYVAGAPMEKFSVINLVDLAGSEKAGSTGATGDRLKEGSSINLSLTMLGQCISILADKASGKRKNEVVPFRNSNLTRILQNALGGNSKTIMVCAISPAFINFEETLSTLRYADNAKKIQNSAVINESVQDRMIRELKEENKKLKEMLVKLSKASITGQPIDLKALGIENMAELIEDMNENEKILDDIQKPWAEKLAEAKAKDAE
jgi:kinesin family member 13